MRNTIIAILLISVLLSGCSQGYIQQKETHMDTEVTIIAYSSDSYQINEAFKEIARIDLEMNSYSNTSMLASLNEQGYLVNPGEDLVYTINKALYYSGISYGAFDITIKPTLDLYEKSFAETGKPPSDEDIKSSLEKVGYKKITLSKEKIALENGTEITLGGIAKGYAVDSAIDRMSLLNSRSALVNAGGDIRALGNKDGIPFKVALANPENTSEYITVINLADMSVATSGNYERYFDPEKNAHHIMNPKTGYSSYGLISTTVIAPYAIDADALATTVFVLGAEDGMKLIESIPWAEALVITEDREIIRSSGFGKYE